MWHVLSFRGKSYNRFVFPRERGWGVSPYCILPNENFKPSIFRWKIKSKPDQFSGGFITQYLHCTSGNVNDPLCKIRPILDLVSENIAKSYKPRQHKTIDEGMITYKGRNKVAADFKHKFHRYSGKYFFSSPELKAQVSFFDRLLSVYLFVRLSVCKLFTFSSSY